MRSIVKVYILLCVLFVSSFFSPDLFSQKKDKTYINNYYDAVAYMYENNYKEALTLLQAIEAVDRNNPNIWYKIGVCYLNINKYKTKAYEYLEKASKHVSLEYVDEYTEKRVPVDVYLYLGVAYKNIHEFDLALESFNTLRDLIRSNRIDNFQLQESIDREEKTTYNAMEFIRNPVNVNLKNLGNAINSKYSDHSPVINKNSDILYFTSKRPLANEPDDNQDEDIYVSNKDKSGWQPAMRLNSPVNTDYNNESVVGLSEDGNEIIFFQSGADFTGEVLVSDKKKGSNKWGTPRSLRGEVNSKSRETHYTVSKDMSIQYFTSTRKGGYGGLDIYVIRKLPDGQWSKPQILPPNVNTPYDEETPYIHSDGVTLYFSSKGHNSMGGYDIFYTKINRDGTFTDPVNLGYPINSINDDVAFMLNYDEDKGYFATERPDGFGDYDIYEVEFLEETANRLIVFEVNVKNTRGEIIDFAQLNVYNITTEELTGVVRNSFNGKYELLLEVDNEYEITAEASGYRKETVTFIPTQDNYRTYRSSLIPVVLDDIILRGYSHQSLVYFYEDSWALDDDAKTVIDGLLTRFQRSPGGIIHVTGVGYDEQMDKKRYEEIRQYLVSKGVRRNNVFTNQRYPDREMIYDIRVAEIPRDLGPTLEDTVFIENILFAFDRYNIESKYYDNLNILADYLNNNPNAQIEIGGHTDAIGTSDYNYLLSYYRSKAVKDYLVGRGNNPNNIITAKYGKDNPIAANRTPDGRDNPAGRQYNRRAEFKVLVQGDEAVLAVAPLSVAASAPKTSYDSPYSQPRQSYGSSVGKYTIQVIALKKPKPAYLYADLEGLKVHVSQDGWYRYYVGEYNTYAEVQQAAERLRAMGYKALIREMSFFEN